MTARPTVDAVLFDRDGTLVEDVPYNADPALVRPVEGAHEALGLLRARGVRTGVVTNQSGIARGLLTRADADRVNGQVERLLGPFDVWEVCPHGPQDGCACRKPAPGMVLSAAHRLGVPVERCVVVGDIGADVEAARRAGAGAVLVPTPVTRPEETAAAPHVAPDLLTAVRALLAPGWPPEGPVLVDERPLRGAYAVVTGGAGDTSADGAAGALDAFGARRAGESAPDTAELPGPADGRPA